MALADFDTYKQRIAAPHQPYKFQKQSQGSRAAKLYSHWLVPPFGGVAPTTAAVPTRATAGAFGQFNPVNANELRILAMEFTNGNSQEGTLIIADRLSHQGGLSGTVATPQTTNLPTAALTRYTSGVGVLAALEIYTIIGTTATTFTASYTNQAGTASRTTQAQLIGATDFREVGNLLLFPLQEGDYGVRSVASVTLAATTGTAGNFGVTLFYPLLTIPMPFILANYDMDALFGMLCQFSPIQDDACLQFMIVANTNNSGVLTGQLSFCED